MCLALQAVETMLQCFCEDCERNDGSPMHPFYMPTKLKRLILASDQRARQQNKSSSSSAAGGTPEPAPSLMGRIRDSIFVHQASPQTQQVYARLT